MEVKVQTHGCFCTGTFCLSCACSGPEEPPVFRHTWVVCRALCAKCHLLCFHNSSLCGLWVMPASLHQIKGFRSQHYWSTTMLLISAKDLLKRKKRPVANVKIKAHGPAAFKHPSKAPPMESSGSFHSTHSCAIHLFGQGISVFLKPF